MSEPKHTPGPWYYDRTNAGHVNEAYKVANYATKRPVATVWGNDEHPEADAALIAAAPDMLAALSSVMVEAEAGANIPMRVLTLINAAIAKAEGR